jgi:hypothetical protein
LDGGRGGNALRWTSGRNDGIVDRCDETITTAREGLDEARVVGGVVEGDA